MAGRFKACASDALPAIRDHFRPIQFIHGKRLIVCPKGEGIIAAGIDHNLPTVQTNSVADGPLAEDASGQDGRGELMIDDELKGFFLCPVEIRREILNALRHVPRDCVVLLCRQHLLRNRIRKNR